jgi:hypothetical protein
VRHSGKGCPAGKKRATAVECLHDALTLPTSVVITGTDSLEILEQVFEVVRKFHPLGEVEVQALLAKTAQAASRRDFEAFKTTTKGKSYQSAGSREIIGCARVPPCGRVDADQPDDVRRKPCSLQTSVRTSTTLKEAALVESGPAAIAGSVPAVVAALTGGLRVMRIPKFALLALVAIALSALMAADGLPSEPKPASAPAQNLLEQRVLAKGLKWLATTQHQDGHWEGNGGSFPVALTALAGMALLAEGSTPFEGEFKAGLKRAVSWLAAQSRQNGLLASSHPSEGGRYMHSHGFALLFLANVYSRCAPEKMPPPAKDGTDTVEQGVLRRMRIRFRKELDQLLKRAVEFSVAAQNHRGGWYYVAAAETGGSDEMNLTALQLQALEAARAAGIAVPAAALDQARKNLDASIPVSRRPSFEPRQLPKQPPAVAAALAAVSSAGDFDSPLLKKWLPHCPKATGDDKVLDLEAYFHFHYAQVMYCLGDQGYAILLPKSQERLTWSAYRQALRSRAQQLQNQDGSWSHPVGPVYATASYLTALQLEQGRVPFFRQGKWEK